MFLTQSIGFLQSRLQFLLHRKRHFESDWTHGLDQQFTNGFIDPTSRNPLTERLGMFDSFALTKILRPQPAVADVIANRHALATAATEDQSLQQCWPFAGRALAPVTSHRLCTFVKALLILLVVFPGQIAGVGSRNQRLPFILRELYNGETAVHGFANMASSIYKGSCIPRIV